MTTPSSTLADIMPYSVRFNQNGTSTYMVAASGQKQNAGAMVHPLPAGVFQMQLAYTGPESCEIWFYPAGIAGGTLVPICKITADSTGVPRQSGIVTVQSDGTAALRLVSTPRGAAAATTSTASVQIFPILNSM
ncbi:hypothetical protein [Corynebacterium aurimucosum]|uniref:hypothetical protein n=1 Tax=Corynebacterium aurimucosum TaxID=169292 RepID=UPI001879667B|nr:hypothetical protein [Corynebacterium aurimucosum]MBE7338132.1 hypothetical protein [Corynebacterium aurimucosum]